MVKKTIATKLFFKYYFIHDVLACLNELHYIALENPKYLLQRSFSRNKTRALVAAKYNLDTAVKQKRHDAVTTFLLLRFPWLVIH